MSFSFSSVLPVYLVHPSRCFCLQAWLLIVHPESMQLELGDISEKKALYLDPLERSLCPELPLEGWIFFLSHERQSLRQGLLHNGSILISAPNLRSREETAPEALRTSARGRHVHNPQCFVFSEAWLFC